MKNKKNFKTDFRWSPDLPGSSVFFMEANKIKNMESKFSPLEDIFGLNEELRKIHIRELHQHIQDLYDEKDSLRETLEECFEEIDGKAMRIESLTKANEKLVKQVLELKAQLHDLLR